MATLVIEHAENVGSLRLGEVLRDQGHRLRVVRVQRDEPLPSDLDEIDAIVTCGGSASALDDSLPWIVQEMDLLRQAHAAALPIVGICLGSQLLARALGGTVAEMDGGVELGWHDVSLTPTGREDPILAGIAWTSPQLHWHRFHASELPEGARLLASSDRTKAQAWSIGLRTYAFQYHPEWKDTTMDVLAAERPEDLEEAGVTREALREQTQKHYPTCARLAQRLFESIALLLMPVDRRYAGVVKDLHH